MSGEELKAAEHRDWLVRQLEAWPTRVDDRFTTNITYLMQEAAKALRVHPLPEQPQEGVSVETAAAFADQISEQHRQRANNAEARIAAALSMMPEADNWQEYALNMRMALSPPSTETKESG